MTLVEIAKKAKTWELFTNGEAQLYFNKQGELMEVNMEDYDPNKDYPYALTQGEMLYGKWHFI